MFWELITVLRLGFVRKLYKFTRSFINCLFQFLCSTMTLPRADEFSPTPTEIETRIARSVTLCFASLELRSAIARRAITPTSQRHLLRRQGDSHFIVTLGSAMKQYTRKRKAIFKNWECKSDALRLGALRVGSLNGAHFRLQSACFWLGRIPASDFASPAVGQCMQSVQRQSINSCVQVQGLRRCCHLVAPNANSAAGNSKFF